MKDTRNIILNKLGGVIMDALKIFREKYKGVDLEPSPIGEACENLEHEFEEKTGRKWPPLRSGDRVDQEWCDIIEKRLGAIIEELKSSQIKYV